MAKKYHSLAGSMKDPTVAYEVHPDRIETCTKWSVFLAEILPWKRTGSFPLEKKSFIENIQEGAQGDSVRIDTNGSQKDFHVHKSDYEEFIVAVYKVLGINT